MYRTSLTGAPIMEIVCQLLKYLCIVSMMVLLFPAAVVLSPVPQNAIRTIDAIDQGPFLQAHRIRQRGHHRKFFPAPPAITGK